MIQGKWFEPGADLSRDALPIRQSVFGRGHDPLDDESWSCVIYQEDQPAATGRIWWRDDAFWLGDIGVLPEFRGRRLGDLALRLLLFKAQSHAAREVRLISPAPAAGFFARLGLQTVSGDDPVEMRIAGDQIELDSCKNCRKAACPNRKPSA